MGDVCKWTENEEGRWDAECGGKFEVLDGTPNENNMHYCPYCGKSLKELRIALNSGGKRDTKN